MAKHSKPSVPDSAPPSLGTVAHLAQGTLRSCTVGALPILNHLLQRMNLAEILQTHLPREDRRRKLPVVQGLLVLLKNLLLSREPIYGLGEWARRYDPPQVGLTPEQLRGLNDDQVGRCLTILFHSNRPGLILAVVRHVVQEFALCLQELHNDSTTVSFCGAYPDAAVEKTRRDQQTVAITWGHNKDHRPDLKQLLYMLTISADGGVPVYCRIASGNVSDASTHRGNWDLLCQIADRRDFLYVADCKLATIDNMNYIAGQGGRFISVLPRTRKEDSIFRERLLQDQVVWQAVWEKCNDAGVVIDHFSISDEPVILPEGYRVWWFQSTHKAELDLAARTRRLQRAEQQLHRLEDKLRSPRSRHRDKGKVQDLVQRILEHYQVTTWLHVDIVECRQETYRQRKRGRPGKDTEYVKKVSTRLDLLYTIDAEQVARERLSDGVFPLVTNDPQLTGLVVLQTYKRQPQIEKRFEQLKTDYAVAPVFLKDVGRIEALLCVYFFVLLVEALLERELRQAMAREELESLPLYPEGRPCRRPTARRLIDLFEPIQRYTFEPTGAEPTTQVSERSALHRKLVRLLGVPAASYEG